MNPRYVTDDQLATACQGIVTALRQEVDARLGTTRPAKPQKMRVHMTDVRKFMAGGKRTLTGLASTSETDLQGDQVVSAGVVIPKLPLPLLFAHSHTAVIGAVHEAKVVPEGLRIRAELVEGIPKADEVFALVNAGALDSFSVGFIGLKGEPIATGTRWTSWRLLEVSVVAVGANPGARMGKSGERTIKLVDPKRFASIKLVRS